MDVTAELPPSRMLSVFQNSASRSIAYIYIHYFVI